VRKHPIKASPQTAAGLGAAYGLDVLIPASDVFALLNISAATGNRWIATGKLPKPEKVGNRNKYRKSVVAQLVGAGA
jgi:hypothetical protein